MPSTNDSPGRSRRPLRVLAVLVILGVIVSTLVLTGSPLVKGLSDGNGSLLGGSECTVETAEGKIGLNREEAKLATTAVALRQRGLTAPDATGIDDAVLQRLTAGPDDDAGPSLSCRGSSASDRPVQELTASGLTPRAERVRAAMADVFGEQSLGGFAPGGVGEGHGAESTHYDGRAIDIFFRPVTEENRRQGWVLAHWLVAHAADLEIQYVIFDDKFWSAHISRGQWHSYEAPAPGNEILRHLDHVHVDVHRGGPG